MSSIPTTFNDMLPPYTVIGGNEQPDRRGFSAVILNRGRRYARRNLFDELERIGFDSVVSVEQPPVQHDLQELSRRFPFVRFVLLKEQISLGEQINLAVNELDSPLFFVLWNDLNFVAGGTAGRMAERLAAKVELPEVGQPAGGSGPIRLCTVPVIQSHRSETLPTLRAPIIPRRKEYTRSLAPTMEGNRSLYPFDGIGIYDRERFVKVGGFDPAIKSPYWQLMDFGFRAHLWGEEIAVTRTVKLAYEAVPPIEDTSSGPDYRRFYLKNLAPAFRKDSAFLPLRRFPYFLLPGKSGLRNAYGDFAEGRRWVQENRFRWKCDPRTIVGLWDSGIGTAELPALGHESP